MSSEDLNGLLRLQEAVKKERDERKKKNLDKDSIVIYDRYNLGFEQALTWMLEVLNLEMQCALELYQRENTET